MSLDASRKGGISSWCRACRTNSTRNWCSKNTGRTKKKYSKDYLSSRDYSLKYRYGISQEDYNSLLEQQDYLCCVCGKDSREMTYHLHVDHDHLTGKVRGLLCAPCNVYLGYIKDNEASLWRALQYLKGKQK